MHGGASGGHDTGMGWHGKACGVALEKHKGCRGGTEGCMGGMGGHERCMVGAWESMKGAWVGMREA